MSATFGWRRRETRHFGTQWVPIVELRLLSASGQWQTFATELDTGAVISVFARSTADFLEIDATAGAPIDLISVGGSTHRYYVHHLWARVGETIERRMRVAIAESEDVPNLLGRVDVLEGLIMTLDGGGGFTTISSAPPTSP